MDIAGHGEVTRDLNLGCIFNGGQEVLGGAISIDVDELVRWLNVIVSSARSTEVVRSRH